MPIVLPGQRRVALGSMLGAQVAREVWARQAVIDGWQKRFPGDTPTLQQLQGVQSVARLESSYGAWGNHPRCGNNGVGSHNWGGTQCPYSKCPKGQPCPPGTFECKDTYPTANGSVEYTVCFYTYPTPADGAASVIANMGPKARPLTWAALKTGDATAISTAMYDEHYYGGFGSTREARIEGHIKALTSSAQKIATGLEEPLVIVRGGSQPGPSPGAQGGSGSGLTLVKAAAAMGVGVLAVWGYQQFAKR